MHIGNVALVPQVDDVLTPALQTHQEEFYRSISLVGAVWMGWGRVWRIAVVPASTHGYHVEHWVSYPALEEGG